MYIIDSGIQSSHQEFRSGNHSRAHCGVNFRWDLGEPCEDEWGHGTHAAGLIGGNSFGVATKVDLVALKVLGKTGTARFSDVMAALNFVVDERHRFPGKPMVVNMSLGTPRVAKLLNEAVSKVIQANITVVVAAGNDGSDACGTSPASTNGVLAVGAVDRFRSVVAFVAGTCCSLTVLFSC